MNKESLLAAADKNSNYGAAQTYYNRQGLLTLAQAIALEEGAEFKDSRIQDRFEDFARHHYPLRYFWYRIVRWYKRKSIAG